MAMRTQLRAGARFLVPLALMALIFAFSAMPSDGEDHGLAMLILRKLTHFGEYFALTGLWWWALRGRLGGRRALLPALLIGPIEELGWRGFLVPTSTPGFTATPIDGKLSMRASVQCDVILEGVRLDADAMLPGASGLSGPFGCLNEARYGIVWGAMGAARSSLETALTYAGERTQFGRPISGFQLTQQKLVDMSLEYAKGVLLAVHLGRRKDAGTLRPEQVSMGKLNNVTKALEICRTARTILGANGISLEYPVIRHMNNLESVLTYEGTAEMHTLIIGQAMTGVAAFR